MAERPFDSLPYYALVRPSHPALVEMETGRSYDYAALHDRVARAVSVLHNVYHIGVGDRVAVLARNCADYLVLHLACARLGAILVALNWRLASGELAFLIGDAEPALLVTDALPSGLEEASLSGATVETMAAISERIDGARPDWREGEDGDRPSLMLYTSGTSGKPKGALISERNLFATALGFGMIGRVGPASIQLSDSPMFHIIGLVTAIRPILLQGGTILLSSGFDAARSYARLADPSLGVTHYFCVPQMAEMIRAVPGFDPAPLRRLTALFTGGAPIAPARVYEWLDDGVILNNGYGMTETGTIMHMPLDRDMIYARPESVGAPSPMIEVQLRNESGGICGLGEVGEFLMRGPGVIREYWRRPEANATSFTTDGWFLTGDLGRRDEAGFYHLVDRKKDMFISGGENVYPAEVEAALLAHPAIAEAAVTGIADDHWGEVGLAGVVLREDCDLDEAGLRLHLSAELARYKIPKHIHFLDALPRTGTGKVIKAELRIQLTEKIGG